jgi:hypothetical protein
VVGGVAYTMPMGGAFLGSGAASGMVVNFSQDGINAPPSLTLNYPETTVAGSYTCADIVVGFNTGSEAYDGDASLGSSCDVDLTSAEVDVGGLIEGSFTGTFYLLPLGPSSAAAGTFSTHRLF